MSFEFRVSSWGFTILEVLLEFSSVAIANSKLETRNSEPFEISNLVVELRQMSKDLKDRLKQLELQLQLANENFDRELRARGFDPEQAETAALPTSLAKLYLQREALREELDDLKNADAEREEEI